jgi:hypothetical protein
MPAKAQPVAYHPYSLPVFTYVAFGSGGLPAMIPVMVPTLVAAIAVMLASHTSGDGSAPRALRLCSARPSNPRAFYGTSGRAASPRWTTDITSSAANEQEPPLSSTYFFPDSSAAMPAALLDPHISNETKQVLTRLIESRHWPVEYQDPKTKLIWLYRPGKPPMLEGVRPSNGDARR